MIAGPEEMKRVNLTLDPETLRWLDQNASRSTLGRSAYTRTILREKMQQERQETSRQSMKEKPVHEPV